MKLFEVGDHFAGHRIDGVAGRGGMAVVYRATHIDLDRHVALKVINPALALDRAFQERFKRESQVAASIRHPHIVTIYDAGECDGLLYITMELVESDLANRIEVKGKLAPKEAIAIAVQIGSALDAAHLRGLVHRDVKPANILLAQREKGPKALLADFGLTRRMNSAGGITRTGQWLGSLDYVSPEQVRGSSVDGLADVYSLGCVLFEMLTGEVPFPADSDIAKMWAQVNQDPPRLLDYMPELGSALSGVLVQALSKEPSERFPNCGELTNAARKAIGPAIERSGENRGEDSTGPPENYAKGGGPDSQQTLVSPLPETEPASVMDEEERSSSGSRVGESQGVSRATKDESPDADSSEVEHALTGSHERLPPLKPKSTQLPPLKPKSTQLPPLKPKPAPVSPKPPQEQPRELGEPTTESEPEPGGGDSALTRLKGRLGAPLLGVIILVLLATSGTILLLSSGETTTKASSGSVELEYGSSWQPESKMGGLAGFQVKAPAVSLRQVATATKAQAGQVKNARRAPDPLPESVRRRFPRGFVRDLVDISGTVWTRYRSRPSPAPGAPKGLTAFLVPTDKGYQGLICVAPMTGDSPDSNEGNASGESSQRVCSTLASSLELMSAKPFPPAPSEKLAVRLRRVFSKLRRSERDTAEGFRASDSKVQADAARQAARAFRTSALQLSRNPVRPQDGQAKQTLIAALRDFSVAYSDLALAAAAEDAISYAEAQGALEVAAKRFGRARVLLENGGYRFEEPSSAGAPSKKQKKTR